MGRRNKVVEDEAPPDPTAWILTNAFAEFVLFHTDEVKWLW